MAKSRSASELEEGLEWVACDLCDADVTRPLFQAPDRCFGGERLFTVVSCARCGLIYLNPRPNAHGRADSYPLMGYVPHQPVSPKVGWAGRVRETLRNVMLRLAYGYDGKAGGLSGSDGLPLQWGLLRTPPWQPGGRLLDVGCGNGQYLSAMRELGWEVVGIEPSLSACEDARRRLGLSVYCGTLEEGTQTPGSFDVVTAWHVLEHCCSPRSVLAEIRRVLRPGGLFMGEVPNAGGWGARLFRERWYHWDLPRHLYAFTPSTLRRVVEEAGFTRYRILPIPDAKGWAGSMQYLAPRPDVPAGITRIRWHRSVNALCWPVAVFAAAVGRPECMLVIARNG